jgi:hypothetical protein
MNARKYAIAGLSVLVLVAPRCGAQQYGITAGQPYMITAPFDFSHPTEANGGVSVNKAMITARGPMPRDQWRIVDGVTYYICGPGFSDYFLSKDPVQWESNGRKKVFADGWFMSTGRVVEVQKLGIRVRGYCNYFAETRGHVVDYQNGVRAFIKEPKEMIFFVANYPYPVAENDQITMCVAKEAGIYTYNTVSGGSASIHKFDYGSVTSRPVAPTPTAEELQSAKAADQIKKMETKAKLLQSDKEMAEKGDSYHQRRMGERFRDGEGVEKNLTKAHTWLALAAGQGANEAARELHELPPK